MLGNTHDETRAFYRPGHPKLAGLTGTISPSGSRPSCGSTPIPNGWWREYRRLLPGLRRPSRSSSPPPRPARSWRGAGDRGGGAGARPARRPSSTSSIIPSPRAARRRHSAGLRHLREARRPVSEAMMGLPPLRPHRRSGLAAPIALPARRTMIFGASRSLAGRSAPRGSASCSRAFPISSRAPERDAMTAPYRS